MFGNVGVDGIDLAALFNAAPNPYVILDPDLVIVGCNAAYLAVTGRRREQIVGRNIFEAFPSDPASVGGRMLRASLNKVLLENRADELALIPYDTSQPGEAPAMRYWSATHTPVRDADGALRYILQHTTDVTDIERLRQHAAGRQNEAAMLDRAMAVQAENLALSTETGELRRLFQQTPSFMAVLSGPQHVFTLVNDAYARLIGRGRDVLGKPLGEAMPEVVDQGFVALLDRVWQTGEPFIGRGVPVTLQQEEGAPPEQTFLDFIYQPIRDADGAVAGIFVQGHDITEQKRAEQEVLQQREILRLAQEAGGVGTFVWDLNSGLLTGSAKFNQLYGFPPDATPRPALDYAGRVHPDDRDRLATSALGLEQGIRRTEYRVVTPAGIRWIERQGSVMYDGEGRPRQVVGASFDITDRKEREVQTQLLAQESAHRIKNLLAMVQAIVSQSLRKADTIPAARAAIDERLLALAQAQDVLTQAPHDSAGLRDIVITAIRMHSDSQQRFSVEGPNLPLDGKTALGLALMVHELGTNAVKYGALSVPEGRVAITWSAKADGSIDWVWQESGGPQVKPPQAPGFGSRLIQRGLATRPGSEVTIDYAPSGAICRARFGGAAAPERSA